MSLLLLAAGCARESFPRPVPAPVADGLGLSTHIPPGTGGAEARARDAELRVSGEIGIRILRRDFLWPDIEPARGTFVFDAYDRMVDDALRAKQQFVGLLTYAPGWARSAAGNDSSISPEDFARFVRATVAHFKGRVTLWEIWNEENLFTFWKPAGDPAAYGALLKAAYRAAKEADPDCVVAFGGMNSDAISFNGTWRFLEKVYQAHPDIGSYYDAMAFHPYTYFQSLSPEAESPQGGMREMIRALKKILTVRGRADVPLWITELGWPAGPGAPAYTYPPNVTAREQAAWLVRGAVLAFSEGVTMFCWYTTFDGDGTAVPPSENYFGLVDGAKTPKESFLSYRAMAAILGPLSFDRDLRGSLALAADEYAFSFRSPAGGPGTVVLWKAGKGMTGDVALTVPPLSIRYDLFGNADPLPGAGGRISLTLSNDPIYIRMGS